MWLKCLSLTLICAGSSVSAQTEIIEERVAEARLRFESALREGEVVGRFLERIAGEYVFSPDDRALPVVLVANPGTVGGYAVGPLLAISGSLQGEYGRLRVEGYKLVITDTLKSYAEAAAASKGWTEALTRPIQDIVGTEVVDSEGELLGSLSSLVRVGNDVTAVIGIEDAGRVTGVRDIGLALNQFEWVGDRLVADVSEEIVRGMPVYDDSDATYLEADDTLGEVAGEALALSSGAAMADDSARAIVADLEAAAQPGAMNVTARSLDRSSDLGRRTLANVDQYVEAYSNASPEERVEIARQWRELRVAIGDHFTDAADFKAIFGRIDNYSTWRYQRIFDDSAAVVAIAKSGRAICSGVLVAEDLVLTAGHCFEQPPDSYEVWFGFVERPNLTSSAPIRRKIAAAPVAPPSDKWPDLLEGRFDSDLLDYAIVRIEPPDAGPLLPEVELLPEQTSIPRPQCLNGKDPQRGDPLYVVGYPQSRPATVHDNARVEFPFRILDGGDFDLLRLDVEADFVDDPEREAILQELENSYIEEQQNGPFRFRRFFDVRDAGQPRMGIVADTFQGNSGGPVFDHADSQCVVGILNKGMPDTGERRTANWKVHERVLPTTAIIGDLRESGETAPLLEDGGLKIQ